MKQDGFVNQLNLRDSLNRQAPHVRVGYTQRLERIPTLPQVRDMASPGQQARAGQAPTWLWCSSGRESWKAAPKEGKGRPRLPAFLTTTLPQQRSGPWIGWPTWPNRAPRRGMLWVPWHPFWGSSAQERDGHTGESLGRPPRWSEVLQLFREDPSEPPLPLAEQSQLSRCLCQETKLRQALRSAGSEIPNPGLDTSLSSLWWPSFQQAAPRDRFHTPLPGWLPSE